LERERVRELKRERNENTLRRKEIMINEVYSIAT
jgi:hypothetical protein